MSKRHYLIRVFDWMSQGVNTIIFNGKPDESLSGRAYREARSGSMAWEALRGWIDRLFFWQQAHCQGSYLADLARASERLRGDWEPTCNSRRTDGSTRRN